MSDRSDLDRRREGTPPHSPISPRVKHLFVGDVPLLYPSGNVGRQMAIELWLDCTLLDTERLGVTKITGFTQHVQITPTIRELGYVI